MKRFKIFMILIPLIFIVTGCSKKEEEKVIPEVKDSSTPLLFEVSKEGSDNKIYLFGSIHAAESGLYPLPDYVLDVYKGSDAIAVEFDIIAYNSDLKAQLKVVEDMMFSNGETIRDYFDDETYEKIKGILEKNKLYNAVYDMYTPVMWLSLIENAQIMDAKLSATKGVDDHIIRKAKDDNKEILELESADFQFSILNSFDSKTLSTMIKESVDNYDEGVNLLRDLYDNYKKGDRVELEKILATEAEEDDKVSKEYNEKLLYGRNRGMYTKLDGYFKEGKKVFCTVGLAHIIGEKSLIELFESNGYTVKQVK